LAATLAPLTVSAEDITIPVWEGEATVAKAPASVVAFDLAAIDTLGALGVTLDGVPDFKAPAFLEGAMGGVATMGSLFEPDLEKLAVLGPDLIVAGGRSQEAVGAMSEVAPTIDMTIWGEGLIDQSKARTSAYGAIFGKEAEADAINAALDDKIAAVQAAVDGKGAGLIVMANGGKLSAYGDDSRFGWLHTTTGLPAAFAEIDPETHGEAISFEFIADVNPDWILVIDRLAAIGRDGEAAAVTMDNPLVAGTTAGQNGQIIYLDSAPLYLAAGGANAMQIVLDQFVEAFGS
ncbi:MAG: siderophore ABC transporter substrate-binding protein, partial [Pseudomonadota bacterium]